MDTIKNVWKHIWLIPAVLCLLGMWLFILIAYGIDETTERVNRFIK